MDVVRKLILEKLAEKGLTMSEASLKIGKNHAYLQQFLKRGYPVELGEKSRIPLAELLGVPEDQLRGPSTKLPKREYVKVNTMSAQSLVADSPQLTLTSGNEQFTKTLVPGENLFGSNDLPVFGTAQDGQGALIVTDRPVESVAPRPPALLKVQDGYGMRVTGDSMSPEHKSGSIALVHPFLPPEVGKSCVFRGKSDTGELRALIREFRGETETLWKVHQHTPPRDYTLKKSDWPDAPHKAVGNFFP